MIRGCSIVVGIVGLVGLVVLILLVALPLAPISADHGCMIFGGMEIINRFGYSYETDCGRPFGSNF